MSLGGADRDVAEPPAGSSRRSRRRRSPGASHRTTSACCTTRSAGARCSPAPSPRATSSRRSSSMRRPARFDARCLADGIAVAPGETLWSERFARSTSPATRTTSSHATATRSAREMGARVPRQTPAGLVLLVLLLHAGHRGRRRPQPALPRTAPPRAADPDGADRRRLPGRHRRLADRRTRSSRAAWRWLASEIKQRRLHARPLARAVPAGRDRRSTFAEHPDWVVRDDGGEPVVAHAQLAAHELRARRLASRRAGLARRICSARSATAGATTT